MALEKLPQNGLVVGGFTYHQNQTKKNSNMRYLVCSEYKRLICKARAVLPVGGSVEDLILRQEHNHPPYYEASIRDSFIREIKKFIVHQPEKPLKQLYEGVSALYLGCAEHKKSGCRGRATIPVGGFISQLKVTQPHNHPPDSIAEEKDAFIKGLKAAVRSTSMENVTLKRVYERVAEVYVRCSMMNETGCKASYVISVSSDGIYNKDTLRCVTPHNHPPNELAVRTEKFLHELQRGVEIMPGTTRDIYNFIAQSFPDVARVYGYKNVVSRMHRWLRKMKENK